MSASPLLRAAAQQALEALENCSSEYGHRCNRCDSEIDEGGKVAATLRAALAQPAASGEPVAYINSDELDNMLDDRAAVIYRVQDGFRKTPLYAAPQPAPARAPLTDEQLIDIWADVSQDYDDEVNIIALGRAIEAAHGIKKQP